MVYVKDLWQVSPEHYEMQWASIWMLPNTPTQTHWKFSVAEVIERLNEWLGCLGSEFKFEPDPLLSNEHYAWMEMRSHTQAFAIAVLGRMAAQTLLDERG